MPFRMKRKPVIHQMAPGFLYGDAIGNQARFIRGQLRQWGYASQVYAQFRDNRLRDPGADYTHYRGGCSEALIFHYSIGSPLTQVALQHPGVVVPYYHNVTPPEFIRNYNPAFATLLEQGRQDLVLFKDAPLALAASEYNRQEMLALGFKRVEVLPYLVLFDELRASAHSPLGREIAGRYNDGWTNILFVGRLVPNKRQDNLIRAFNFYHRLINPRSRLLLIGSDANTPGYRLELQALIEEFDLKHVELLGPIGPREGLGAYYQTASIFVCLSEHEGCCVPLLEAMAFDVPVLSLHATGVPYTLGESGILLRQKRYDVLAEALHLLVTDVSFRTGVLAAQRRRLADFDVSAITRQLQQVVIDLQEICN